MSRAFLTPLNASPLASNPASGTAGDIYYNSGSGVLRYYNGTSWVTVTSGDLSSYAPLSSPTFTGVPAAPTAAVDTNTTQVATTAYVIGQGYLKSSTASSTYAPLASPTFTGTPAAPTASLGTNTTQVATTAFVARVAPAYQATAPSSPSIAQIWVDSGGVASGLNQNDYLTKTEGTSTYLTLSSAASTYLTISNAQVPHPFLLAGM